MSKETKLTITLPSGGTIDPNALKSQIAKAQQGDAKAMAVVRETFDQIPSLWKDLGDLSGHAQDAWLKLTVGAADPLLKEAVGRTMRAELAGPNPMPLERLLVERILACWLQVQYADREAAAFEGKGGRFAQGEYWQKQQDRAQKRYLAAIRTLAQVRRLLTPPSVQVNIAEQQVNIAQ